ncbi:MAG: carboxypeptidase-like regulatory domain-containing protein, partial [Cyclobacteriaceae bacterium]|nr:carboxypeptidase-like regulatory domain-containing protein [Cyclobacteriaceae bacterium]
MRCKLVAIVLFTICNPLVAQQIQINIETKEATIGQWIEEISKKGSINFTYNAGTIPLDKRVRLMAMQGSPSEILKILFKDTEIRFLERKNKIILILSNQNVNENSVTLSGYIKEYGSGESLIGATLLVITKNPREEHPLGVVSNAYGFYSITLPIGQYELQYSYVGYETKRIQLTLDQSFTQTIALVPTSTQLDEVVITANPDDDPLQKVYTPVMGKTNMDIGEIKKMPALMGEVDVIKSIQTLPGVRVQGEGSTNFFVRGGNADQNLILLDEAPVYNASHLMGFFSVFNPDAIKNVQFYRSGMPAQYGGRLSSLLEIRMKEGNLQKFSSSGGIGLTASRLTLEGPIKKEESSFIISARRTYADLFLKLSADEFTKKSAIYFYDINAKFNWKLSHKDKIYLSGYFGRDLNKFLSLQYAIDWGNATSTIRWNHLFNDRLFSNTTLLYSNYDY